MARGLRSFASDNNSGACPEVAAALLAANAGHAVGYGDDPWTDAAQALFKAEFGEKAETFFVVNGTGANVLALSLAGRPGGAVLCAHGAHIAVDEAGAPEAAGLKPLPLASRDGKLDPDALAEALSDPGNIHQAKPVAVSISQCTELGSVYTAAEVAKIASIAHRAGLPLHMDGARIANAAVALGLPFRAFTVDAGVDLLSFGGTKNGLFFGEALVILDPRYAADAPYLRKTRLQLASKMRFISAQFEAYLSTGAWKRNAEAANAAARELARRLEGLPGLEIVNRVETNAVFARMPSGAAELLRGKYYFYDWEGGLVRFMTSFDSSTADIDGFIDAARGALRDSGNAAVDGGRPSLSFRRALASDKEAVLALCAKIWEGDDYIPGCYDAWVADGKGEFTLVHARDEAGGESLVGLGKLSWLSEGEAWLEGLRKDPDAKVRGLGSALCGHFLNRLSREEGLRSVRFSTYFENAASIKLNTALGFRRVATASVLHVDPSKCSFEAPAQGPEILRNEAEVLAFVRASGWFGPFVHEAWRSIAYSDEVFAEKYVRTGSVVGYRKEGRIVAAAAIVLSEEKKCGALPFFDAEDSAMGAELARACLAWFHERGQGEVEAYLPDVSLRALPILRKAGFSSWDRLEDYLVFELPLEVLAGRA